MEELRVEVHEDHLQSLTSSNPIKAIEELIYNALDTDASFIDVMLERNEIGGIRTIIVKDNGVGIHKDNKFYVFCVLYAIGIAFSKNAAILS